MSERLCSEVGCDTGGKIIRGRCRAHYYRLLRQGAFPDKNTKYAAPEEAFAGRTEWQGECLVWIGYVDAAGYGRIAVGNRTVLVHRFAYIQAHGSIPRGLVIDHRCHNKACCNVAHLRAATNKQNAENLSGASTHNTSGYRGVSWSNTYQKWLVSVGHDGKRYYGGTFTDIELANQAAIALRLKLHTHNDTDRK